MKKYAVEIMGHKDPTYLEEADVIKLVKATNMGYKLVLVGRSFINPATISRIRREYDVHPDDVEKSDPELNALLETSEIKKLN